MSKSKISYKFLKISMPPPYANKFQYFYALTYNTSCSKLFSHICVFINGINIQITKQRLIISKCW